MKLIAGISICAAMIRLAYAGPPQGTEAGRAMDDPLFGMTYDTSKVHFEDAPAVIGQRCAEIRGRKLWLFAEWRSAGVEYFIVSGLLAARPDGPVSAALPQESDGGIAVELRGPECRLAALDAFMSGRVAPTGRSVSIDVTNSALHGLASDALQRFATAFGGKKSFLDAERKDGLAPEKLPPALRVEFQTFAKAP
jgi:hypothetical protein